MALGTVVLCPGILGSELRFRLLFPIDQLVWLNPAVLIAGGFRALVLPVPGDGGIPPPGNLLSPGPFQPHYYGMLRAYLETRGWRVASPLADWRRPLAYDAALLAETIRGEAGSGSVRLLCHSRGGLVARAALGLLAAAGQSGMVSHVVAMGTPHAGSLAAAQALAGWASAELILEDLGRYLPLASPLLIGALPVLRAVRSWASVYELLPAPGSTWVVGIDPAALYLPATYAGSPLDPAAAYLAAAAAAWAALPPVPAGTPWVDVAGLGVLTPDGVPDVSRVVRPGSMTEDLAGDGVVMLASAHQGTRRLVTTPCAHDLLPVDGRLWPYLHLAFLGQLDADVAIQGFVLQL